MILTAYFLRVGDKQYMLGIAELPGVQAAADSIDEAPAAVRKAAAEHTGRPADSFTVKIEY